LHTVFSLRSLSLSLFSLGTSLYLLSSSFSLPLSSYLSLSSTLRLLSSLSSFFSCGSLFSSAYILSLSSLYRLYDEITSEASEYYLFQAELDLLKTHSQEIVLQMGLTGEKKEEWKGWDIVELGAGYVSGVSWMVILVLGVGLMTDTTSILISTRCNDNHICTFLSSPFTDLYARRLISSQP
jgi:hypothetical protein